MPLRCLALVASATFALMLVLSASPATAQGAGNTAAALAGQVASAEEGPMEGVIVSAKKDGSTVTVSVISDAQGRYSFRSATTSKAPKPPRSRPPSPQPPISSCARPGI